MRSKFLKKALRAAYRSRIPSFMWGPPGVGKSAVVRQVAEELGVEFMDLRLLYHDPSDFKFPVVDVAERMVFWVNSIFPKDPNWKGIICLEELPLCDRLLQAITMQATLDRMVGEYKIPAGASFVACGNRIQDKAGVNRLLTPVLNRFMHLDMEVSTEDWVEWALEANVHWLVRGYLQFKSSSLHRFNPSDPELRAFPSPRSWHMVSNLIHENEDLVGEEIFTSMVAGLVSQAEATDFAGYCKIYHRLPVIDELLAKPQDAPAFKEPGICYAVIGAVVDRLRHKDVTVEQQRGALVYFKDKLPAEFGLLGVQDAYATNRSIFKLRELSDFSKKYTDDLAAARAAREGK